MENEIKPINAETDIKEKQNKITTVYEIKSYDKLKERAIAYISQELGNFANIEKLESQADYDALWDIRTKFNKQRDDIKAKKSKINKIFLGEFNKNCDELAKLFDNESKKETALLNAFEGKLPQITLTISHSDSNVINAIKDFAEKQGAKAVVKGQKEESNGQQTENNNN